MEEVGCVDVTKEGISAGFELLDNVVGIVDLVNAWFGVEYRV